MNQILVSEKVYVTPELKRRKKLYKFNFILSVFLVVALFGYYVYGEFDRNSKDKSEEILSQIEVKEQDLTVADSTIKLEDDVLVVVLDDTKESKEEVNLDDLINANKNAVLDTKTYKTNVGAEYSTVAVVNIPSINITYPIIYSNDTSSKTVEDLLKISVVKYWGPEANTPGNFCVVGHNYHNKKFFSKCSTLKNGDTIYITDKNNKTLEYRVYKNYVVEPTDLKCTSQLTNGETEITLITCTMTGKQRTIIKARAVNSKNNKK